MAPAQDTLQAVTIVADRGVVVSRTDTLSVNPFLPAGATLVQLPALYVGDYGGDAGLKTANLRGLGSAHTAIYVDGVRVANVQSGQADLGSLDFNDFSSLVVDYAQNSITLNTAKPVFHCCQKVQGAARLGYASFGTWQPYAKLAFRLGKKWSLSTHAGGLITGGNFPLEDGSLRVNNDLKQIQAGADLWGDIDGGDFHAKVFFNGSGRGTPGSLAWPSPNDRQTDRNIFGQWRLRKSFSPIYTLHLSGKTSFDKTEFISAWGNNIYEQTDFQLNSVHKFTVTPWWTLSLAANASLDGLFSDLYKQDRIGTLAALASAFRWNRLKVDVALEYAGTFDEGQKSWHSLSPSLDLRLKLSDAWDLVAFGRRAYRTPTFNELYYPGYGNPDLKPEDAWLADVGVDWHRRFGNVLIRSRLDGFYNWLTDKIVSAPSADPSIWLPYNIGKVQAFGADFLFGLDYAAGDWVANASLRYSYQNAVDKTPDSYSYGEPIPYIAKHTVILSGNAAWKGWALGAVWNLRAGRHDAAGELPDWNTLDLQAGKSFRLGHKSSIGLNLMARNLLNQRYETVSGYPMPGRSFLVGLEFKF